MLGLECAVPPRDKCYFKISRGRVTASAAHKNYVSVNCWPLSSDSGPSQESLLLSREPTPSWEQSAETES